MSLLKDIEAFQNYISQKDILAEKVSKRTVGWHVEHCLKVIHGILRTIQKSDPNNFKKNFNLSRSLIFASGYIPRGVGKAPKIVNPQTVATAEELHELVSKTKDILNAAQNADPNSNFEHPYFGMLNKQQSFKFMEIHNRHHLKIIKSILK